MKHSTTNTTTPGEFEQGDRVKAKSGALRGFYYWPELPELFSVEKTHLNDSGALSLS